MQIASNITAEEKYNLIRQEILNHVEDHSVKRILSKVRNNHIVINKQKFSIKKIVEFYTKFLDDYHPTTSERFYYIYHNIRKIPRCNYCQKTKCFYYDFRNGYGEYCSHSCSYKHPKRYQKIKETNLKKYGYTNVFQSEEIKQKAKETIQKRYGVDNVSKLEEIKKKKCETSLKNYGVEHTLQAKEVKESIKNTNLRVRNVEYSSQSLEVKEKIKQNNLKKYGVEHTLQVKEIREKGYNTMLKKYGYKHPLQVPEFQKKFVKTNLERFGFENPNQSHVIRQKTIQTNLEKYGIEHTFQAEPVKELIKQTNLERYGVEYPQQSKEVNDKSRKTRFKLFLKMLSEKEWFKEYKPLFTADEYKGVKKNYYKFKHRRCGFRFHCRIENGRFPKCPKCYPKNVSTAEREIQKFIQQYANNVILNSRSVIPPKEIDIYLPDCKLAIEYNGLYWHSTAQGKDSKYHINKSVECWKKKIELIHIFENEWAIKQDAVKSLILENMNKLPYYVDSNDCQIKSVKMRKAMDFIQIHSMYGPIESDYMLGLYHDNHLISLMGLDKYKYEDYYLIRHYCNYNFVKINSLPIFLEYLKDHNLMIHSDLRFTRGQLFVQNEFKYFETIQPRECFLDEYFLENSNTESSIFDCGYFSYYRHRQLS